MAFKESHKTRSLILSSVSLLLLVGIGVGVNFLSQKNTGIFDIRNRASGPTGTVSVELVTPSLSKIYGDAADGTTYLKYEPDYANGTYAKYVGDTFPVKVFVNTGGKAISGVAFRLMYTFTGTTPQLQVLDSDSAAGTQIESHAQDLGMSTQVNSVLMDPVKDGNVIIDFSAVSGSSEGFSTTTPKLVAVIRLKANAIRNVTIVHDPQRSQVTDKATGLDILKTIDPLGLTVLADTAPPEVSITAGPVENSSATSDTVTFTWSGKDKPDRPDETVPDIEYQYRFDGGTVVAAGATKTMTKKLGHGTHTFEIAARDPKGSNKWSAYVKRTFKLDLTPFITSVSPVKGHGGGPAVQGTGWKLDNKGTLITITGRNFGPTKGKIAFGTTNGTTKSWYTGADIISWTDTKIEARAVPTAIPNGKLILNSSKDAAVPYSNEVDFDLQTTLFLTFQLYGRSTAKIPTKGAVTITRSGFSQTFQNVTLSGNVESAKPIYSVLLEPLSKTGFVNNAADYTVSVTEASRLRKQYKKITLSAGALNVVQKEADADAVGLADFNHDNKFDIQDFGLMMTEIKALSNVVTDVNEEYDINGDGIIDVSDISLLLSKYRQLELVGDP